MYINRFVRPTVFISMLVISVASPRRLPRSGADDRWTTARFVHVRRCCRPTLREDPRYESHKYDKTCGTHVERFLRCLARMEELPEADRPDFALIVGDIHPHELTKHMARVRIPLHAIAGNHENRARRKELREMFLEDFEMDGKPSDYYSFVHKGCRFIGVCDAGCGGDHVGHLCSEEITPVGQCEWLERELAQHESCKFIFAHIPPHPDGLDKNGYLARNDSRYFNDLVTRTRPAAMFFGHQHAADTQVAYRLNARVHRAVVRSGILATRPWGSSWSRLRLPALKPMRSSPVRKRPPRSRMVGLVRGGSLKIRIGIARRRLSARLTGAAHGVNAVSFLQPAARSINRRLFPRNVWPP